MIYSYIMYYIQFMVHEYILNIFLNVEMRWGERRKEECVSFLYLLY